MLDKQVIELERLVNSLMSAERGIPISNDSISKPPTDAELDTAFGNAATLFNGFSGLIDDGGAGNTVYACFVVNNSWWHVSLTKAL